MKKLLHKTLKPFSLYALVVLTTSVPAYYYLVDEIWLDELDEHNAIIADRTMSQLNQLKLNSTEFEKSIALWNKIQPGTQLKELHKTEISPDSVYTVFRKNIYVKHDVIDRLRVLSRTIYVQEKPYRLFVETNVEETEETVIAIAMLTLVFFLILVVGFLLLNKWLSTQLWKPFRSTLAKLQTFHLNNQSMIIFEKSDILEFEELNEALTKLIAQNIDVYKTQKEFTENASHELQTPLAIIKNKLDIVLQKEELSERQYQIIEEINKALSRISRINRNLLLLAKIENHQFDDYCHINLRQSVDFCLAQLEGHIDHNNINIRTNIEVDVNVAASKTLMEILVNNLLSNAIKHNLPMGEIIIDLNSSELVVMDSGHTSLDPSQLFKRFAKGSGSGLGLAIIKEICNQYKWDIAYSYANGMHVFRIRF